MSSCLISNFNNRFWLNVLLRLSHCRKQDGCDSPISATLEPQLFQPTLPYTTSPFNKVGGERAGGRGRGLHFDPLPYPMDLWATFCSVMFFSCQCSSCLSTRLCLGALSLGFVFNLSWLCQSQTLGSLYYFIHVFFCLSCVIKVHRAPYLSDSININLFWAGNCRLDADSSSIEAQQFWCLQRKQSTACLSNCRVLIKRQTSSPLPSSENCHQIENWEPPFVRGSIVIRFNLRIINYLCSRTCPSMLHFLSHTL